MSALSGLFIPTGERPCCGPCHILRALMQIPSFSGFLHCANEGKISPRSFDTSFAVTQVFPERRYFAFRRRPQKFSSPTPGQGICDEALQHVLERFIALAEAETLSVNAQWISWETSS